MGRGKRIHWEGVEPPPLAVELEGKDDNRFTTSVLYDGASYLSQRVRNSPTGFPPASGGWRCIPELRDGAG